MAALAYDPFICLEGIFNNPFEAHSSGKVADSEYFVAVEVTQITESFILEGDDMAVQASSKMDLFVAIGLPILLAALVWVGGAWMMYARLDDKIDSQVNQLTSDIKGVSETLRVELGADRKAFTEQFENIRSDMRQDRAETVNRHMELMQRLQPSSPAQ